MALSWWKILTIVLVFYSLIAGLLVKVPALAILNETIRNLYYHVTMWFGMIIILLVSLVYSIKALRNPQNLKSDIWASEMVNVGVLMGLIGIATGSVWARFTWGSWWVSDPKLNGAAITLLIYFAYLVLRKAIEDPLKRARLAAVYNVFAYVMLIVFLMILPRMNDSLHPGNGGNPGFGGYDLNNTMKIIFYPATLGWTLLGVWITTIAVRIKSLKPL